MNNKVIVSAALGVATSVVLLVISFLVFKENLAVFVHFATSAVCAGIALFRKNKPFAAACLLPSLMLLGFKLLMPSRLA